MLRKTRHVQNVPAHPILFSQCDILLVLAALFLTSFTHTQTTAHPTNCRSVCGWRIWIAKKLVTLFWMKEKLNSRIIHCCKFVQPHHLLLGSPQIRLTPNSRKFTCILSGLYLNWECKIQELKRPRWRSDWSRDLACHPIDSNGFAFAVCKCGY
jgi:hypothetical protein